MEYKHAVVIGRFQPFHRDHMKVVEHGLEIAEKVIVVIGSSNAAPSTKNPWSLKERADMVRDSFPSVTQKKLSIVGIRDHFYNDQAWLADVQAKTDKFITDGETVALLGSYKDQSSYYLNMFPQWEFVPVRTGGLNATDIREALLNRIVTSDWEGKPGNPLEDHELNELVDGRVSKPVRDFLRLWTLTSPLYPSLSREWLFQRDYRKSWEDSPFPPTFVTADAVVVCSGHVLVVKRKVNPGKGLYALPGGFVRQDEFIQDAALRELKEETGIRIDKRTLEAHIIDRRVFDYPTRSERGRTITHGFYVKLQDGRLPEVKGGDDAAEALWMPLFEAFSNENKFFEDHIHIILRFVGAQ